MSYLYVYNTIYYNTTIYNSDSTSFLQLSPLHIIYYVVRYRGVLHSNNNDMILLQHPYSSLYLIYLSGRVQIILILGPSVYVRRDALDMNTFKKQFFSFSVEIIIYVHAPTCLRQKLLLLRKFPMSEHLKYRIAGFLSPRLTTPSPQCPGVLYNSSQNGLQ